MFILLKTQFSTLNAFSIRLFSLSIPMKFAFFIFDDRNFINSPFAVPMSRIFKLNFVSLFF